MRVGGRGVGLLMELGVEGQFLGRREGRGWRLKKIGGRKANELILEGQTRIRRGIVFRDRGLFEEVKKRWKLGVGLVLEKEQLLRIGSLSFLGV